MKDSVIESSFGLEPPWMVTTTYLCEIISPYITPYASASGDEFILMGDYVRPHWDRVVEEYLEDQGLEIME